MEDTGPSPETVDKAVRAVAAAIAARYDVVTMRFYGSRARGDHRPDSDADLAVVLGKFEGSLGSLANDFGAAVGRVLIDTGVVVSPMAIRLEHWQNPNTHSNPFYVRNVQREGLTL